LSRNSLGARAQGNELRCNVGEPLEPGLEEVLAVEEASVAVVITARGRLSGSDEQMFNLKNDNKCVP